MLTNQSMYTISVILYYLEHLSRTNLKKTQYAGTVQFFHSCSNRKMVPIMIKNSKYRIHGNIYQSRNHKNYTTVTLTLLKIYSRDTMITVLAKVITSDLWSLAKSHKVNCPVIYSYNQEWLLLKYIYYKL